MRTEVRFVVAVEECDDPTFGGGDTRVSGVCGTGIGLSDDSQMWKLAPEPFRDRQGLVNRSIVDDNMLDWLQRLRADGPNIALDDARRVESCCNDRDVDHA